MPNHSFMLTPYLGAALFQEIEIFCLNTNCSKIILLSSAQRLDSHAFFEKQGFKGTVKRGFVKYRSAFREER